jgi:Bacterial protein of unknown function (DUF916)
MTGRHRRPGRRKARAAVAALTVVGALAAVTAPPAAAGGPIGNGTFGISPAPGPNGQALPYFTMTLAPGQSAAGVAIVSNQSSTTQRLKIASSAGTTAANGGSAYEPTFTGCSGSGCWITGLPAQVTLAPGAADQLRFTVQVPAGTPQGQYLAGISAEPATTPKPVPIGSRGSAGARAIVIEEVTVGVAVTVGKLAALHSQLQIPTVTGQVIQTLVRLNIRLDNTGQTFSHAAGQASCTAGGAAHSYQAVAGTVLPHQSALIAVNTPGLSAGTTVPCTITLHYGASQVVTWTGKVAFPGAPRTRIVRNNNGSYSVVPVSSGIPLWAWLLGALLVALLLLGIAMFILYYRRARARGAG